MAENNPALTEKTAAASGSASATSTVAAPLEEGEAPMDPESMETDAPMLLDSVSEEEVERLISFLEEITQLFGCAEDLIVRILNIDRQYPDSVLVTIATT